MFFFDWFKSKKPRFRPEIIEIYGKDSPFIGYRSGTNMILIDRDNFEYQFGDSRQPDPAQADLNQMLCRATRVRGLIGGMCAGEAIESPILFDTSQPAAIAALQRALEIVVNPATFDHCACLGGPTLEFFTGGERIATIGVQHGRAIRWSSWKHDAELQEPGYLNEWLIDHGVWVPLLELLYQNPFARTGGRFEGSTSLPLSAAEQRLFVAEYHRGRKDLDLAMTYCEEALSENPELGPAFLARGIIHSNRNEPEACIADMTLALKYEERTPLVYYYRAVALDQLGRFHEAIDDCDSAIEIDPDSAEAYNSRGLIYMKLNQLQESLTDLTRAIQIAPHWELPFLNRGQVALLMEDWDLSVQDYTIAITTVEGRNDSHDNVMLGRLYLYRSFAYRSRGDFANAKADLRLAFLKDPNVNNIMKTNGYWMIE